MFNNSFQTVTSVKFGSKDLENLWWNVQNISLPTISLSPPQSNSRAGALVNMAADTCVYGELSVTVILDKEWKIFDELYNYFLEGLNVDNGKYASKKFELWAEFTNSDNEVIKKFWFHSCRLTDFGGIVIDTTSQDDDLQFLTLTFQILYYTYEK